MLYHSDEIPLDIGFSLTGLLVLFWYKAIFLIFKNRAYVSVTSIALNNVNVRGGNAIKPFA